LAGRPLSHVRIAERDLSEHEVAPVDLRTCAETFAGSLRREGGMTDLASHGTYLREFVENGRKGKLTRTEIYRKYHIIRVLSVLGKRWQTRNS
jgi:hypothetical protein